MAVAGTDAGVDAGDSPRASRTAVSCPARQPMYSSRPPSVRISLQLLSMVRRSAVVSFCKSGAEVGSERQQLRVQAGLLRGGWRTRLTGHPTPMLHQRLLDGRRRTFAGVCAPIGSAAHTNVPASISRPKPAGRPGTDSRQVETKSHDPMVACPPGLSTGPSRFCA